MIRLYKKSNNGIEEIKDIRELETPFMLSLSEIPFMKDEEKTSTNYDKYIDKVLSLEMKSSKIDNIEEIPFTFIEEDFLDDINIEESTQIVENVLLPFLTNNTNSVEELIEKAKKINFITYGFQTQKYIEIEKKLIEELSKTISKEDVIRIIKEMSLISIGSNVDTSGLYANTVSIIDVNDKKVENEHTSDYKRVLEETMNISLYGSFGKDNNILYIFDGNGNHNVEDYFGDNTISRLAITSLINYIVKKSLQNESKTTEEILKQLKKYSNVLSKSTDDEPTVVTDEFKINKILSAIAKYSSDVTYKQILVASGLIEDDENILSQESDRKIRAFYDDVMHEVRESNKESQK